MFIGKKGAVSSSAAYRFSAEVELACHVQIGNGFLIIRLPRPSRAAYAHLYEQLP
jgi:hypothetical protein